MKALLPLLLAGNLWLVPAVAPAQDEAPPTIELDAGDELARQLVDRFPEIFAKNPDHVVLRMKPGDGARQIAPRPEYLSKYASVPSLDLSDYQGSTGKTDDNVMLSTRQGDNSLPKIKIVVLAPGNEGLTVKGQPSLWWYQSQQSRFKEVTFILTEMSGRPRERMRIDLKAMPKGYNSLNLADPALNLDNVVLKSGVDYQWTIAVRSDEAGASVFNKIRRVDNPALEKLAVETPAEASTLKALSEAGNWYELFDSISRLARYFPDNEEALAARAKLIAQAKLTERIRD
jgi:hypothetical protein